MRVFPSQKTKRNYSKVAWDNFNLFPIKFNSDVVKQHCLQISREHNM